MIKYGYRKANSLKNNDEGGKRVKKKRTISLSEETDQRLLQHANLRHTSVSQLVTDWVWAIKMPAGKKDPMKTERWEEKAYGEYGIKK